MRTIGSLSQRTAWSGTKLCSIGSTSTLVYHHTVMTMKRVKASSAASRKTSKSLLRWLEWESPRLESLMKWDKGSSCSFEAATKQGRHNNTFFV